MIEIPLKDLPDWYSNKVRKKVEPVRKKIQRILEKIQLFLTDIKGACENLAEVAPAAERDEVTSKSVDNLAKKYLDRLNELEIPSEPLYFDKITKFSLNLKNLLQYLWQQGRKWVPKLRGPAGQTYKVNIRELNYHIKSLHDEWRVLESMIEDKALKNVKIYEDIFDQIDKMQGLLKEIDGKKEDLKVTESERTQLTESKSKLEEKYNSFNKNPLISERTTLSNELQIIIQNIKGILGYFRKPLRKFEKLLSDGYFFARQGCSEYLTQYINNPLETFFAEQDNYPNLKLVMQELKNAVPRLNVKARDEKKLIKEIEDINNGSLQPFRQNYKEFYQKFQEISSKLEAEGLLKKLEETQNEIALAQKNVTDVELKYSRLKDVYDKNLLKMRDIRDYLEKAIKSTTNEDVKIAL